MSSQSDRGLDAAHPSFEGISADVRRADDLARRVVRTLTEAGRIPDDVRIRVEVAPQRESPSARAPSQDELLCHIELGYRTHAPLRRWQQRGASWLGAARAMLGIAFIVAFWQLVSLGASLALDEVSFGEARVVTVFGGFGGFVFGLLACAIWWRGWARTASSLALVAGVAASTGIGCAIYAWGAANEGEHLGFAGGICALIALVVTAWVATREQEAAEPGRAWFAVPVLLLLACTYRPASGIGVDLGALIVVVAWLLGRRFGAAGVAAVALGTPIVILAFHVTEAVQLTFWPWNVYGLLAAILAAHPDWLEKKLSPLTETWGVALLAAIALQSQASLALTDRLQLDLSPYLLLRGGLLLAGLRFAAEPARLARIAACVVAATVLLWMIGAVTPHGVIGLDAAPFAVGLASNSLAELIWCLIALLLGVALSAEQDSALRARIVPYVRAPLVLVGLALASLLFVEISFLWRESPGGDAEYRSILLSSRSTLPEVLPLVAFAAGFFRRRMGLALVIAATLLTQLVVPALLSGRIGSGESVARVALTSTSSLTMGPAAPVLDVGLLISVLVFGLVGASWGRTRDAR